MKNMKTIWKLLLGFMIKLAIFMSLVAACYYSFTRMTDTRNRVIHTHEVIEETNRILVDLLNVETGERGFAITGKDEFLEPLRAGVGSLQREFDSVRELTGDNPAQQDNIATLHEQFHNWIAVEIDPLLALRRAVSDGSAPGRDVAAFIASTRGKDLFDSMRATLERMQREETGLLHERDAAMRELQATTRIILLAGGGAACLIGVAIAVITSLGISGPLKKTTAYAIRVASGDYSDSPGLERNDEFGALDRAVRSMVAQLKQRLDTLTQLNTELQDFTFTASHDLQEPLRKIRTFGDRLRQDSADRLSETGRDSLARMENAARRMQELIDALLAYSRVSTRQEPIRPVDLNLAAGEAVEDLEARMAETGGRIDIGALPAIRADAIQMRQLFVNLFSNALKYHRPGVPPVVLVRAIRRDLAEGEGECVITVSDNGIGFDERYLGKLFTPFQRLHGKGYQGAGIGLTICRKIAERHGGTITAAGAPGRGATFTVTLRVEREGAGENPEIPALAVSTPA